MPKIKKRADGRYAVTATINGKRKYFYGRTKAEAQEKCEEYCRRAPLCPRYDENLTLSDWADKWLQLKEGTIADTSLASYSWLCHQYVIPYLGSFKLSELTPLSVHGLIKQMDGLSSRTVNYVLTILSAMLKTAVQYQYITVNVVPMVKRPKRDKRHQMITLSREQVQEFLLAIPLPETRMLFSLAFTTGLRRSELLGLRWSDIDFKRKILSVAQTVILINGTYTISETTKNSASRRSISLDDKSIAELKKHRLIVQKRMLSTYGWVNRDLVFPGKQGGPRDPKAVSRACKKYASKIGVPEFTMHGTRHTHATLLIEAGVNFKIIQMRLGHSSYVETMNTYSHITPLMEADVVDKISKIF